MNTTEAIKEHERRLAVMRAHAEGRAIHDHELYSALLVITCFLAAPCSGFIRMKPGPIT